MVTNMNEKEIAFIICKNNMLWYEECVRYIQDLYVPDDYAIDIISIEEADSMAMAYNAAMESSNAKYKVYLHQDVFILHRKFIADILQIFNKDSSIGMIGMIGCRNLPSDAACHHHWDTGRALVYDGIKVRDQDLRKSQDEDEGCVRVEAVDGFLIATQYDYRWREELLDGWHFCDVSQSLEMREHGKKTVVPWQEEPWCYHDCGIHNGDDYEYYRLKMLEAYPQYFGEKAIFSEESSTDRPNKEELDGIHAQLVKLAETGAYDAIWKLTGELRNLQDREIREIVNLAEIYALENASLQGVSSEWWSGHNWNGVYSCYNLMRFILLRMAYQREDERMEKMKEMMELGKIHKDAAISMANRTLVFTDQVFHIVRRKMEEPLVSVILPVYNGADFVGETIESILNQTYKNIELIIVDDASVDQSRKVIGSYKDSRIKTIFCKKNRNVVNSGNIGFEEAKGKYIALIGHDDLWKADKLEKQIAFLEEHPSYSVCFSLMDVIDENRKIVKNSFFYNLFSENNQEADEWVRKLFVYGNSFCAPSACIRKTMLDKAGYYRYALVQLQDYDLWLRLFLEGEVYIYPEKLTFYRRFNNGKNLSAINAETQIRSKHEENYIRSSFIKNMPEKKFTNVFYKYIQNPEAGNEKEIWCEKILFLFNCGISLARYDLADLLEDAECRRILEEKYQIDLNCFYKMNTMA